MRIAGGRIELCAEAWLGGAVLPPGAPRALHSIRIEDGDDASSLLESWAAHVGTTAGAPYVAGWCSWYQYFDQVSERAVRDNLALAGAITASGRTPGIWIAPFLAGPESELARRHPDWLAGAPNGDGFAIIVDAGYRYLKLDFTFSAMPGRYSDPTRTPAERVRAGYDAVRRGAGDDVLILGCGAPLGAVVDQRLRQHVHAELHASPALVE